MEDTFFEFGIKTKTNFQWISNELKYVQYLYNFYIIRYNFLNSDSDSLKSNFVFKCNATKKSELGKQLPTTISFHHFFSCMTWWFIVITLKWPLSGAVSWIHQNLAGTFFHQKRQMTQRSIHFPIFFTPSRSNLLCFLSTAPHHQNKHFDKSLDVLKQTDFLCFYDYVFQKRGKMELLIFTNLMPT